MQPVHALRPRRAGLEAERAAGYCEEYGRPYAEIDRTSLGEWNLARKSPAAIVDELGKLHEMGFTTAIASLRGVETLSRSRSSARDVIPQVARL